MPIYEYDCPRCGPFERLQSIQDDALKRCPSCRRKVTKLISQSSFHLKGGGWYADAYEKKANGSSHDSSEGATSSASTGSNGDGASATAKSSDSASTKSKSTDGASTKSKSSDGASAKAKSSDGAASKGASSATGASATGG